MCIRDRQYPNYGKQSTDGSSTDGTSTIDSSVMDNLPTVSPEEQSRLNLRALDNASIPVVINITAPPNTVIDTTQAASTNGTFVTVNRNNPLG